MTTDNIETSSHTATPISAFNRATDTRHSMTGETITAASIIIDPDYQYRVGPLDENNVAYLASLIRDGATFATPISLSCLWGSQLYLTDGFHRMEAFKRLGISEIPIHHFSIEECASLIDIQIKAMGANTKHGKRNSTSDYRKIIERIVENGYPRSLMKNAFEPDIPAIAKAIGTSKALLEIAYNKYTGRKESPHPTLSVECKARRNKAILAAYCEDNLTANAIAQKFQIKSPKTVAQVISDAEAKWAADEKQHNEMMVKEEAELAARADAAGYSNVHLYKEMVRYGIYKDPSIAADIGYDAAAESRVSIAAKNEEINSNFVFKGGRFTAASKPVDTSLQPFDFAAITGFTPESNVHTKAAKPTHMTVEQLRRAWNAHKKAKMKIERNEEALRKSAALVGLTLE